MLFAPLPSPPRTAGPAPARSPIRSARAMAPRPVPPVLPPMADAVRRRVLMVWLLGGLLAVALLPAVRGGPLLGGSLPFWLVLAPAINLAWLTRHRWLAVLGTRFRAARMRRPAARRIARRGAGQPSGQRAVTRSRRSRAAASSPDRSSNS